MNEFSIDGEEISHSPRTQEKRPENQSVQHQYENNKKQTIQEVQTYHPQQHEMKTQPQGWRKIISLQFYEKYFQVSQDDVLSRMIQAMLPHKTEFVSSTRSNPDFYGPLWLWTTVIFLLGSTGNLARYFSNQGKSEYIFKLEVVRYAVLLIYGVGIGLPILMSYVLKALGCNQFKTAQLLCLYGYSFTCYIPVLLLCIIPISWLHVLLLIYASVNTIGFMVMNMKEYIESLETKSYIIFGIIGGAQIFLFVMFKIVFFDLLQQK